MTISEDRIEEISTDPLDLFTYALRSPESQRQYPRRFKVFLDFLYPNINNLREQSIKFLLAGKNNPQWAEEMLMKFCNHQKKRVVKGEITGSTIPNYFEATKLFCEMNNLNLNWKRIHKGIPKGRQAANDRSPTLEEIQKIVEYPDRRIKPIIFVMVSSGIRLGSWDYLKWKHVKPIYENNTLIAAKLTVYAGELEEYYSFITPEAYKALSDWMDFRASYGEKITKESWLMRDMWRTTNITYGANLGLATVPQKLDSKGIYKIIYRALGSQGVRIKLAKGEKRHEFKTAHGFRKYFKTHAEQLMRPANVEVLMGHSIGISDSYYKPTEEQVLEDYKKAVDILTINYAESTLKKKVIDLEDKNKQSQYIIRGKLEEKDEEIKLLKSQFQNIQSQIQSLISSPQFMNSEGKNQFAKKLYDEGQVAISDSDSN